MKFFQSSIVAAFVFSVVFTAHAADKVVVIPLGKAAASVAGTDTQMQYNDNGTQAGAEVYYDKSTGFVGIGNPTPITNLDVFSPTNSTVAIRSTTSANLQIKSEGSLKIIPQVYSDTPTNYPMIVSVKAGGTQAAPEAVLKDNLLFGIYAKGFFNTTPASHAVGASQIFVASENWDTAGMGGYIKFETTENRTTTRTERMRIDDKGNVGIGTPTPLSKLSVSGLPTGPPSGWVAAGALCITANGDFWVSSTGVCPAAP